MTGGWFDRLACRAAMMLSAIFAGALPAVAEDGQTSPASSQTESVDIDMFAPTGPALITLGAAPRRNAVPGAFKEISFEVGNTGNEAWAAAVTTYPYWLAETRQTLEHYRNETRLAERILARTQLGIGLARADGETERTSVGIGMQTQLLDRQDYRFDHKAYACVRDAWQLHRGDDAASDLGVLASQAAESDPDSDEFEVDGFPLANDDGGAASAYLAAVNGCRTKSIERLLAAPSWLIGFGTSVARDDVTGAEWEGDGVSIWSSYRLPVYESGRFALLAFVRGDLERTFELQDGLRAKGNALAGGSGLALQVTNFRLDLVAEYNDVDLDLPVFGFTEDRFVRYSAVADIRLQRGMWIELSGGTVTASDLHDETWGSVSFKVAWGEYLSRIRNR